MQAYCAPFRNTCTLLFKKHWGLLVWGCAQLELSLAKDHKAAGGAGGTPRSCWNP